MRNFDMSDEVKIEQPDVPEAERPSRSRNRKKPPNPKIRPLRNPKKIRNLPKKKPV